MPAAPSSPCPASRLLAAIAGARLTVTMTGSALGPHRPGPGLAAVALLDFVEGLADTDAAITSTHKPQDCTRGSDGALVPP
jgi:hypothetical protein